MHLLAPIGNTLDLQTRNAWLDVGSDERAGEAQVMLCLIAVVPCLSCWLYPRHRVWDDEGPVPDAEAVEPLSHILPCWPSTMQVSALPASGR